MPEEKFIEVFNHGTNPITITSTVKSGFKSQLPPMEMAPTELHFKLDGAKDNTPSFAIVMEMPGYPQKIYGQFSINTLQKALAELGYTLYQP